MTIDKDIKSLQCLKVEKMFIGVIDKNYHRRLFDINDYNTQFKYYDKEHKELINEILKLNTTKHNKIETYINIRNEIADCINTLEILYEIILNMELKKYK